MFNLAKVVCSHGLFMMAPNHWDPLSKTLPRPLRLDCRDVDNASDSSSSSVIVRISQPSHASHSLQILVLDFASLSPQHQQSLIVQVKRMLRLSETEERNVKAFQEIYVEGKERGFGRVFRSPTLFEDTVKCVLLCNCQWPRTLSMAMALCELQLELQCPSSGLIVAEANSSFKFGSSTAESEQFIPKTPAGKESKRKLGVHRCSKNLTGSFAEIKVELKGDAHMRMNSTEILDSHQGTEHSSLNLLSPNKQIDFCVQCDSFDNAANPQANSCSFSKLQPSVGNVSTSELYCSDRIGNFPTARELASLDEKYLAKRCKLGYRASRILNLARGVVEGRIQLQQLEEACSRPNLSDYSKLAEQISNIDGFGPFTTANVLMCMGFYHVIPFDSETIRHLNQVHARNSTIKSVQRDVEVIYGKFAPFQFLAYWSEVWHFYEEKFGKLSEMPHSSYKLITAANMRPKMSAKNKRIKIH